LTEGLELTAAGIKAFEDISWNEQRPAATGQGIMRVLACFEEIMEEKKRPLSGQTSLLHSFRSFSGILAFPFVVLNIWR